MHADEHFMVNLRNIAPFSAISQLPQQEGDSMEKNISGDKPTNSKERISCIQKK